MIPYPALERHGVIGDRRTAALVSADGVIDWFCLPDYDGTIVFGSLLDYQRGGYWKLGPDERSTGRQRYMTDTAVLETEWQTHGGLVMLRDLMHDPGDERNPDAEHRRLLVRSLESSTGTVECVFDLRPSCDFQVGRIDIRRAYGGFRIRSQHFSFHVWSNARLEHREGHLLHRFRLRAGQRVWAVFELGSEPAHWTSEMADRALEETVAYWRSWIGRIRYGARRREGIRRAAICVHLLTYSPQGSVVAAPTSSLPERIGGHWTADYRLSWIRDASLSLAALAELGDWQETERFLQWIARLEWEYGLPLQPLYGIRGERTAPCRDLKVAFGYRGSTPVRVGNHAYRQFQPGSLGFLADCVWIYLNEGHDWRDSYWELVCRIGDYASDHWQEPDNGIWELNIRQHYVSTRVMHWVALDRAIKIAGRVGATHDLRKWKRARDAIRREIMRKGWSTRLNAFRQHYGADSLDSSALLVSVMELLPGRDRRVLATIERVEQQLSIDGLVYRFAPSAMGFKHELALGEMEGAFLPCTFWLATAYAKAGEIAKAEALLTRVEEIAGETGLLAEAVDPRTRAFLGNIPLLFSHVEYVRAVTELDRAHRCGG